MVVESTAGGKLAILRPLLLNAINPGASTHGQFVLLSHQETRMAARRTQRSHGKIWDCELTHVKVDGIFWVVELIGACPKNISI